MKKILAAFFLSLFLFSSSVYASEIVYDFSGGDIADFVHYFGWREDEDGRYRFAVDNGNLVFELKSFQGGGFTVTNKSKEFLYSVKYDGGHMSQNIAPGEVGNFSRSYTYKGFQISKGLYSPPDPRPDPEPDPKPDPEPDPDPPVDIPDPEDKPVERTKDKYFQVPVNMSVIGQYATDFIRVASPYMWLFAVVFFGLIILSVLKRVFRW